MPLVLDNNLPTKFPTPSFLSLNNFKKGVISLIDKSRLPKNALEQADNIFLVEDGQPTVRPGTNWFGSQVAADSRGVLLSSRTNLITNPSMETNTTGYTAAGYQLDYNGTSTVTTVTSHADFIPGTGNFSISFKMYSSTASPTKDIIVKSTGGSNWLLIRQDGSDKIYAQFYDSTINQQVSGATSVGDSTWHDVVVVRDGRVTYIYVDGSLDGTSATSSGDCNISATSDVKIGQGVLSGGFWTGSLKQLRWWNGVALSAAEVANLYNGEDLPQQASMVAEYLHEDGSGTTLTDSTGSHDGSIANGTWTDNRPTLSQSSAQAQSGSNSLLATHSSSPLAAGSSYTISGLTVSTQYTVSAYFYQASTDYCGILIPNVGQASTVMDTSWKRVEFTFTATSTSQLVYFLNQSGTASFYLDAVQCEAAATATGYFDASFTDTTEFQYDWGGTAHASASTEETYQISPTEIDGFGYFDFDGAIHLVAAAGGTVYRSTDDGTTWDTCTGYTLTSGSIVEMNQYNDHLYLTNGTDNITRYDGTTTLTQYSTLSTPAKPTAVVTGLTGTGINYYYKITRVNEIGYSAASDQQTETVSSNLDRSQWVSGTDYVTLTTPVSVTDQERWDVYLSTDNVYFYYLSSMSSNGVGTTADFIDDGTAIQVPSTTAPTTSTATGPKVEELTNVGSRMYGVRDTENRYRIWFSSGSTPKGAFSGSYDGGYLDWQEGGKLIPKKVEDYRDGKGTPLATVWCDSADGEGAVIQMSLEIFTVGDVSITIPSAYKLPGSRGTPSPGSVVNVLNDYMFYNSQAIYNLGSRQNFQNLLSTDEASANIRPSIKQISTSAEDGIASVYFDAKVYFSVPYGDTKNNNTIVYDTERKAWLPYAFTIGFKKFLRYTTTTGSPKLLALTPGDNRITEISSSIQGDYNSPFTSVLKTGLYPVTKNRFEFQWTEEAEMEFSNPTGTVTAELIGIERGQGFSSIGTATITATLSSTGHDTFLHGSTSHGDTSTAIDTFSESSVKRYFRVGRELNAVQWKVTTNSLDGYYVLRTLQTWGTDTSGGKPRSWRVSTS